MEFQWSCCSLAAQCWSGSFTAHFDADGRTNASLANSRMPTSSLFRKTRVTGRTATTIEASRSFSFRENALPVQSSQDCSALLTRCYQRDHAGRSTLDMIFSVRQLQEKCVEQQRPLYMVFVDLTKAFAYVSRSGLFHVLQ